jgi:predicted dehydrogenase
MNCCVSASFYVGQHLDQWREGRSARDSYSGRAAAGGGVLRDLSHELDLACWLFGRCEAVVSIGGRFAEVTHDSDDCWTILARFERCDAVSFQLNYLDRIGQRRMTVIGRRETFAADLVAQTMTTESRTETFACERNDPIAAMHRAALNGGKGACTFAEGVNVVDLIDAIERSNRDRVWVTL